MQKLWLDDIRNPPDKSWDIARSYQEAKTLVDLHGWPHYVSFDHDLGLEKDGHDFAKYLIKKDLDNGTMPIDFGFQVHSANPIGKANIEGLFKSYFNFKQRYHGG